MLLGIQGVPSMRFHEYKAFGPQTRCQPHTKLEEGYREMLRCCNFVAVLLLLSPAISVGRVPSGDSPAFTAVPELSAGFDLLYEQKFAEARQTFVSWESRNLEDPFAEVAVAASYLFEELYLQGVLTSDFFPERKEISARD